MGSGGYNAADMTARVQTARFAGQSMFTHHTAVASGAVAATVHSSLDVRIPNTAGIKIRESLDSADHPESEAFVVGFDVTGSMGDIPRVMVEKLPNLMGMLLKKRVSEHPQIMFAAIGDNQGYSPDVNGDKFPLQVGQFESDNRMDDAFTNIILEGGGKGQGFESYDLLLYYLARHTKLDCWDKRGVKAMLFLIGDERVRSVVSVKDVKDQIGDTLEADIPIETILEELRERYTVFFIYPKGGSYWDNGEYKKHLEKLFGERLIRLEDHTAMCETIAGLIAIEKGIDIDTIKQNLKDFGATDKDILSATTALGTYKGSTSTAIKAVVTGDVGSLISIVATSADADVVVVQ